MTTKYYTIWTAGGNQVTLPEAEAKCEIQRELLRAESEYVWEARETGIDSEDTWNSGDDYEFPSLAKAVDNAIPSWQDIGLTQIQAALVALTTELVVSTDWKVADWVACGLEDLDLDDADGNVSENSDSEEDFDDDLEDSYNDDPYTNNKWGDKWGDPDADLDDLFCNEHFFGAWEAEDVEDEGE